MAVTAGVIGCGSIAKFHFGALEAIGARVQWVCDTNEAAARPYAERFGAGCTVDYGRVLDDPAVDVVEVLTVSSAHRAICLDAIDAGKAVICEKTLAENADDALAVVRAARQRGTIFYTAYMKRFIPAVRKAKELLPTLGRIIATHVRAHQPWGGVWSPSPGPRPSEVVRRYGGGILVCGGSHILDLVCFFLGRPRRLAATTHTPPDGDFDVLASGLLLTDHGPCQYEALAHGLGRTGFLGDGWDERVEIIGTAGRLEVLSAKWDEFDRKASLLVHYDDDAGTATQHRFPPVSPFALEVACFCGNIEAGAQGDQSALTGYDVDELIAAIRQSAASQQAVDVNYRI